MSCANANISGTITSSNATITGGKINVKGAGELTDLIRVTDINNAENFAYIQPGGAGFANGNNRVDIMTFGSRGAIDVQKEGNSWKLTADGIYNQAYQVVTSETNFRQFFGTGSEYSYVTTNLRGNTVRLYAHDGGGVYLGYSGNIAVTSDEKLKNIYEIDDKYIKFFKNLKPITYIYKDRGHRNHIGFGARQVEEALTKAGLTTEQFAGVLIDKDVTISADEAGTEKDAHYDELYSLRYEEFIALNTLMIQKQSEQIEQLQKEIKELKGEK